MVLGVGIAVHVADHDAVGVGAFGDEKPGLLGAHRAFLGVGDDRDAGLTLGLRAGTEEHGLVVGDDVFA